MKVIELFEALKDIPTDNVLYHMTNIRALYDILKSGGLKGSDYPSNTINDNPDKEEIATARKSTFTDPRKKDNLSGSIGNVKITLYSDRIKAGVRHAKVAPIAELPLDTRKRWISHLTRQFKMEEKDALKFINDIEKNNELLLKQGQTFFELMFKKKFPTADDKTLEKNWKLVRELYKNNKDRREGEERIGLNKNTPIPVSDKFMSIEILPEFKEDWIMYPHKTFIHKKQMVKEFINLLENNSAIVKNNTYARLIKTLSSIYQATSLDGVFSALGVKDKTEQEDVRHYLSL